MFGPLSFSLSWLLVGLLSLCYGTHDEIYIPPQDNSSDYHSLEYYLCDREAGEQLSSNTTFLLSPSVVHGISPGNFCLIENVRVLTIMGLSDGELVEIECMNSTDSRGFGFYNVSSLTIANVRVSNCGGTVTQEAVRYVNDSMLYYGVGQKAVFLFNHCPDLLIENVQIEHYRGYGIIGANLLGMLRMHRLMIRDSFDASNCIEFSCAGSGAFLSYQESEILPASQPVVQVVISDSVFQNNSNQVPDSHNHIALRRQLEQITFEPIPVVGGSGLGIVCTQESYNITVSINESSFTDNIESSFGAVFMIFLNTPDTASVSFLSCNFIDNKFGIFYNEREGHDINIYLKESGPVSPTQHSHFPNTENEGHKLVFIHNSSFLATRPVSRIPTSCIYVAAFPQDPTEDVLIHLANIHFDSSTGLILATALPENTRGPHFHVKLENINAYKAFSRGEPGHLSPYGNFDFRRIGFVTLSGSNFSANVVNDSVGPVFYMYGTDLHLIGQLEIVSSDGANGAAMLLEADAHLVLHEPLNLILRENHAVHGGAIYSVQTGDKLCLFQYATERVYTADNISDVNINITLIDNRANVAGISVYAYPLYICDLYPGSNVKLDTGVNGSATALIYETIFHTSQSLDKEIVSIPTQLCSCDYITGEIITCTGGLGIYREPLIVTYPGYMFTLGLTTLDNNNNPVYSQIVAQLFGFGNAGSIGWTLGPGQDSIQVRGDQRCNQVNYTVYTTSSARKDQTFNALALLSSSYSSSGTAAIRFLDVQDCPPGFEEKQNGACECISLLLNQGIRCNINTFMVTRPDNSWIGVVDNSSSNIGFAPICPQDYCRSDISEVNVSEKDHVCIGDRSGILCGACTEKMSVVFGTTECKECSHLWLLTIPLYALAGILLVVLLFVLRLTVSTGTINGLIFYANIVSLNANLLLGIPGLKFLLVFISILNLDLGFPLCFYDGMTETVKTGLQFVFPVYLWGIVAIIIILSRYSIKIAQLTSRSSVPVLATLIYLSYSKLINTVVTILIHTTLEMRSANGNDSTSLIWYFDGNMQYLTGGHIILFLVAMVTIWGFLLPYTIITTVASFSMRYRIVNYFKPLIDSYHGPYKDRWRFWLGARLWLLVVIYIIYGSLRGLNIGLMLLLQTLVLVGFIFLQIHLTPFKNVLINLLDLFFMVNYSILAVLGAYLYPEDEIHITSGVLVGLAFVMFWVVVAYHLCLVLGLTKYIQQRGKKGEVEINPDDYVDVGDRDVHEQGHRSTASGTGPTSSELNTSFCELRESLLEYQ